MLTYNVRYYNFVVINNIILYIEIRITLISKDRDKKITIKTTCNSIAITIFFVSEDYTQLVEIEQKISF